MEEKEKLSLPETPFDGVVESLEELVLTIQAAITAQKSFEKQLMGDENLIRANQTRIDDYRLKLNETIEELKGWREKQFEYQKKAIEADMENRRCRFEREMDRDMNNLRRGIGF